MWYSIFGHFITKFVFGSITKDNCITVIFIETLESFLDRILINFTEWLFHLNWHSFLARSFSRCSGVFKHLSNLYDGAFCENNQRLITVTHFCQKLHLTCFTGFWILPFPRLIFQLASIGNKFITANYRQYSTIAQCKGPKFMHLREDFWYDWSEALF